MVILGFVIVFLLLIANGYVIAHHKFNEGEKVMLGDTEVKIITYLGYRMYHVTGNPKYIPEKKLKSKVEYEYDLWRAETMVQSNSALIFGNQHYKNIVEMGKEAVPFIIKKIKKRPDYIVHALDDILGPIKVQGYVSLEDYCKLWIKLYS